MIRDAAAKWLLIPLAGISIAFVSGSLAATPFRLKDLVAAFIFWLGITFFFWQGVVVVTAFIRRQPMMRNIISRKIVSLLLSTMLLALLLAFGASSLWNQLFQIPISQTYAFIYVALAPVISLTYEILFLQKEQELHSKVVAQLDYERQTAELQALTNELDPHFMFNALNVLSPLISVDAAKAQVFTIKLAQVYRYLLHNRESELVPLQEELRFIQDYIFLLQIRHENKLKLETQLKEQDIRHNMILPFALQTLVENAIKHNQLSEEKPLVIFLSIQKGFIHVRNTVFAKPYGVESTHVGLKNLRARYKLCCNKNIIVYNTADTFVVKLPLLKIPV